VRQSSSSSRSTDRNAQKQTGPANRPGLTTFAVDKSALVLLAALAALAVRVALLVLLLAALLTLAGFLLLLLLILLLLVALLSALLSALILLITHGTLLTVGVVSRRQREARLHSSLLRGRVIITVLCAVFLTFAAQAEDRSQACNVTILGTFDFAAVLDARTFTLRDGREVLLAGIEVPATSPMARASLEKLLAGGKVVLKQVGGASDRYGRLVVQAFVPRDGAERWIQEDLLATGQAQVSSRPGDAACTKALLAAEAPARRAKAGMWADSSYRIKASDDLAGLTAQQNRFTVAEGKVLSVRESAGTIYINFGRVWSRNLTVTILRRNRPAFAAAGMDLKKLEGARIRVRGWVELRNGPRIEATRPEQIEVAANE